MASETSGSVGFYEFLAWAEKNKTQLVIGFVAAVVLGGAIATYMWRQNVIEAEANEALLKLQAPPDDQSGMPMEAPASEYLKVVQQHSNTDAARRALLLAGGALFKEGRYADAASRFEEFLKDSGSHAMAPTAAFGLAASLESQGKQDEAVTAYQNVSTRYPKSAVADDAKLALARIYETKNQLELALKIYNELTIPTATGSGNTQAQTRKQQLLAKHPELAVTNTPPAISTNAPAAVSTNAPAPAPTNAAPAANPPSAATPENTTPPPATPAPEPKP